VRSGLLNGMGGPSISADGRYVAFDSEATNLVKGDTNNTADVFVRDRLTGTTERVSVASDGAQANAGGTEPGISGDGRFVAFVSVSDNLVPGSRHRHDARRRAARRGLPLRDAEPGRVYPPDEGEERRRAHL
jgi:WD40-like Beta Propeller Repeat